MCEYSKPYLKVGAVVLPRPVTKALLHQLRLRVGILIVEADVGKLRLEPVGHLRVWGVGMGVGVGACARTCAYACAYACVLRARCPTNPPTHHGRILGQLLLRARATHHLTLALPILTHGA